MSTRATWYPAVGHGTGKELLDAIVTKHEFDVERWSVESGCVRIETTDHRKIYLVGGSLVVEDRP